MAGILLSASWKIYSPQAGEVESLRWRFIVSQTIARGSDIKLAVAADDEGRGIGTPTLVEAPLVTTIHATAHIADHPLLFIGEDFAKTDLVAA
jgi:uncharacterized protein with PIN domain